ncbi:SMI1/KNR4 family protein [Myxococcus sp. SDU36]|uniref:SMI1/KNR4 family protein n=1 Tax=Myxococcus sp. SDU36 TaxID=2831967 RepID=UPI0025439038|nr:SMI1/KNR4 family protein [Myxococcus sp. SDU36]
MTIGSLLTKIVRAHFPHSPTTAARIATFEAQLGWRLDDDRRAFYLHCDGAELFRRLPDASYVTDRRPVFGAHTGARAQRGHRAHLLRARVAELQHPLAGGDCSIDSQIAPACPGSE